MRRFQFLSSATLGFLLLTGLSAAQSPPSKQAATKSAEETGAEEPADEAERDESVAQRTKLNLLGQTDTASGESRRNENVQFNLIDNNALKELNIRLGTTATIIPEFSPEQRYYGAEFGAPPDRAIHVQAPAGGRGLHGTVFYSHNNSVFSARSFFQVGGVKPANENHYGFNAGLGAWKGARLTIEGSQQKIRGNVNGNVLVPLPEERTPLATDPELRAIVERFLNAYPDELPNRPDIDPRMLNTNSRQRIDTDRLGGWLDQSVGAKDKIIARYLYTLQSVDAFQFVAGQNPDTSIKSQTARLSWDRTWSATTITRFTVGFDRTNSILVPEPNAVGTSVMIFAVEGLGPSPTVSIDRTINRFRYAGQLQHVRGQHVITAGGSLVRCQYNGFEMDAHRGIVRFSDNFGRDAITNYRMGTPSGFTGVTGHIDRGFRNWIGGLFLGDRWQVKPNLTLNAGLRYEFVTRPYDVNGLSDLPFRSDANNFGPHFGFAYRMKERWGVIRGSYGLQYGQLFPVTYGNDRLNPPYNYRFIVPNPDLTQLPVDVRWQDIPPDTRSSVYRFSPDLVVPYSHQYNLSWEPQLADNVNLQFGYVGSRTMKLYTMWFNNRARPVEGIPQTSKTVNERRPDASVLELFDILSGSRAYFDAFRATLRARTRGGLAVTASYWFSKAMDLGGDYTTTLSGPDARVNRSQSEFDVFTDVKAVSNFHQPHAFLLQANYQTPSLVSQSPWVRNLFGAWEIDGVLLAKSGTPFTVQSGSDSPGFGNVDGQGSDRVNLIRPELASSATIGHPDTSTAELPEDAFGFISATDRGGNLGRNTFRKGRIANLNMSLSRTWRFASEKSLTFSAESINLLNTAQFAEPNKTLSSPSFGQITNTLNDGRTFRFLLRFAF